MTRLEVLRHVAQAVPPQAGEACVLVAVDGVDGSGKTSFADELAEVLRESGRVTLRISVDDFHHVRERRYRLGRHSAEGFWLDSFDYVRLRTDVLQPLGPGGSRRYRTQAHDLHTDEVLWPEPAVAPVGAIVLVDGLFLHRPELVAAWDFSIFLQVPFAVTAQRMAVRDGSHPDPHHPSMRRYVDAQRRYLAECSPAEKAGVVIDNSRIDEPRVLGAGARSGQRPELRSG